MITGIVIAVAKKYEARVAGDIRSGKKEVLMHWTYSPEQWRKFAGMEVAEKNKMVAIILAVVFVAPTVILVRTAGFNGSIIPIGGVALFLALFIGLPLYLSGRAQRKSVVRDCFISRDGVLIGDTWESWTYMGAMLTDVKLIAGSPSVVQFEWMQPGTGATRVVAPRVVSVPVPEGREKEARGLVASLQP